MVFRVYVSQDTSSRVLFIGVICNTSMIKRLQDVRKFHFLHYFLSRVIELNFLRSFFYSLSDGLLDVTT